MDKSHEEQKKKKNATLLVKELELAEKMMVDYETLHKPEAKSRTEMLSLQEKLRVSEN